MQVHWLGRMNVSQGAEGRKWLFWMERDGKVGPWKFKREVLCKKVCVGLHFGVLAWSFF